MSATVLLILVQVSIPVFRLMVHREQIMECLVIQIGYLVDLANSTQHVLIVWQHGLIIIMKTQMYGYAINFKLNNLLYIYYQKNINVLYLGLFMVCKLWY